MFRGEKVVSVLRGEGQGVNVRGTISRDLDIFVMEDV